MLEPQLVLCESGMWGASRARLEDLVASGGFGVVETNQDISKDQRGIWIGKMVR